MSDKASVTGEDLGMTPSSHGLSAAPSARSEGKYTVTFERIGRDHCVPPLIAEIAEPSELGEEIADAVLRRARKHLRSSDYEVFVNLEEMRGFIVVGGFRPGGSFTIALDEPRGLSAAEPPCGAGVTPFPESVPVNEKGEEGR